MIDKLILGHVIIHNDLFVNEIRLMKQFTVDIDYQKM